MFHNSKFRTMSKIAILLSMSSLLMGNQGCQSTPQAPARVLKRRVQVGQITAPSIILPAQAGYANFDFSYVANQQMVDVMNKTNSFSTANIDPYQDYSPAGLEKLINNDFYTCATDIVTAQSVVPTPFPVMAKGMANALPSYDNSCMMNLPQAIISGSINDFTLTGGGGINVGLSNVSGLTGLSFAFEKYTLQVEMMAYKPLDIGQQHFVSSIQNANGYNGSMSATMNFGMLSLGPSGYIKTPLSTITLNGLTSAVTDLSTQWSDKDPWFTNVLKSCDSYIYINGSSDLGLKVGDILAVKNIVHMWDGKACASHWYGDVPDVTPVGYAQIVSLGDNLATAVMIKGNNTYPHANNRLMAGARVYMHQTAETVSNLQAVAKPSPDVCTLPVGKCKNSP